MLKKILLCMVIVPLLAVFPVCSDDGGDDETADVTKLAVTVTYTGDADYSNANLGVSVCSTDGLVETGGVLVPKSDAMPAAVGSHEGIEKDTPVVVTLTSISVSEGYVFVSIDADDSGHVPNTGDPYIYYNDKSGETGEDPDVVPITEGITNEISVVIDGTHLFP